MVALQTEVSPFHHAFDYAVALLNESAARGVEWKVIGTPTQGRRPGLLLTIPPLSIATRSTTALLTFCGAPRRQVQPPGRRPVIAADNFQSASSPTDVFRFFGRIGALHAGTKRPAFME